MMIVIGPSGAGKSVVLKLILGLLKPDGGSIHVNDERIDTLTETELDPITAKTVDAEIIKLRDVEHVTSILVTHQLQDAFYIATHQAVNRGGQLEIVKADGPLPDEARFLMLRDGQVHFEGTAAALQASKDALLRAYLSGWVPPLVA